MGNPEISKPVEIPISELNSSGTYVCAHHGTVAAFAMCAKCGDMLCADCSLIINGCRYCEHCVNTNPALTEAYGRELLRPKIIQAAIRMGSMRAPERISEVPAAVRDMFTSPTAFFAIAGRTPLRISFPLALCALLPTDIIRSIKLASSIGPDTFAAISSSIGMSESQIAEIFASYSPATITAMAVISGAISSVIRVLLLDLAFWLCSRAFTGAGLKFQAAAAILNFCLIPLILAAIGAATGVEAFSFVGAVLMIFKLSTASRVAIRCTFWQGTGMMLLFVTIATLSRMLY